jgi:hypothetical protein
MVIAYISALVAANLLVAWLGPWFSPINAFFLIGLDLVIRDKLHERWQDKVWLRMFGLIASAGLISFILNPASGKIAIASVAAFVIAGVVDALVYHYLRHKPWMIKSNASNASGALVDSIVFPTIAFGSLMPVIVLLQFAAKTIGGLMWSWIFRK